ncbi:3-deoxy-manno-octulosonate-8-phosphatase KdsC [Celerinatantimonas sp. YJH-8]|uniref:3-deoxy-manno-octulosonate-8-phosphatase KdsC n=1 Tax=Celerinatantimonas sp. YJH-8 TaxID=3228714 RepID=UPI0038C7F442
MTTQSIETLYGSMPTALYQKIASTQLLICDVDGVFSDGRIYLGNQGEELKAFHTRDGFGIKAIIRNGIDVAVITGRRSQLVQKRMESLNVRYIYQGQEDKQQAFADLLAQTQLSAQQCAYIGDDVPDLAIMNQVNLAIAVADAHPLVKTKAHYVTQNRGGFGAVRECCDLLLQSRGQLADFTGASQ